jgi:hypothetical protein
VGAIVPGVGKSSKAINRILIAGAVGIVAVGTAFKGGAPGNVMPFCARASETNNKVPEIKPSERQRQKIDLSLPEYKGERGIKNR